MMGVGVAGCRIYGARCDYSFGDGTGERERVDLVNARDQF